MVVSFYMDVILRPLKYAVLIDIPNFHAVGSGRTGVKQIHNLAFPPGPEHPRIQIFCNAQVDLHFLISAGIEDRRAVLPSLRVVPDGIIQRIEHSPGFIEVPRKKVFPAIDGVMAGLRCRQFRLGEQRLVTGRLRQRTYRTRGEHVLVPAADIGNRIIGPVITTNHISGLRNILRPICW